MQFLVKQVSSLEKIQNGQIDHCEEIHEKKVLIGERFSYQIHVSVDSERYEDVMVELSAESVLKDYVRIYIVKNAYLDRPYTDPQTGDDEDYLVHESCFMPDILVPAQENGNCCYIGEGCTFWVKVDIPANMKAGEYSLKFIIRHKTDMWSSEKIEECSTEMLLRVIDIAMKPQQLIYTRWFYVDCIAVWHGVEIYSERHWRLIDEYIAAAVDVGINMILVPVHTPPLDTAFGTVRPCVQLVDIKKTGDHYEFSFEKFRRFIDICKKRGMKYFEIAHMFSQWGAEYAPNILVTENERTDYLFGWHVSAASNEYVNFLKQYISAIAGELEKEGIAEVTYFHVSDEPSLKNMDAYKKASELIRSFIGKSKTFDALSDYEFYEKGLVECPVTCVDQIHTFLKHDIENQWIYYCCNPQRIFTNCFLAMPSYRTRILGFLLYKYDIKGFLHWGFNFYNSKVSLYPVNPYLTTSADGSFPSGDPFIVYPAKDGVYPSIRGEVTYEAIQDIGICCTLEKFVGKKEVVRIIDEEAGRDLRFDSYPKNKEYIEKLRARIFENLIKNCN